MGRKTAHCKNPVYSLCTIMFTRLRRVYFYMFTFQSYAENSISNLIQRNFFVITFVFCLGGGCNNWIICSPNFAAKPTKLYSSYIAIWCCLGTLLWYKRKFFDSLTSTWLVFERLIICIWILYRTVDITPVAFHLQN